MKRYKIYKSPLGMIEAVKTGWSWPGFFFTLIWLLVKKLYVTAGMVFLIAIIIGFVEFETGGTVLSSFYNLSLGFHWHTRKADSFRSFVYCLVSRRYCLFSYFSISSF